MFQPAVLFEANDLAPMSVVVFSSVCCIRTIGSKSPCSTKNAVSETFALTPNRSRIRLKTDGMLTHYHVVSAKPKSQQAVHTCQHWYESAYTNKQLPMPISEL